MAVKKQGTIVPDNKSFS